jgi:site-specific DNA-methyltransferase (adenine-specific)
MTFADPPFNLKKKYTNYKDNLELQEYLTWCENWITEMVRVTKPTGSIFLHNIPKWLTYYTTFLNQIASFRHWIAWEAPTAPMGKTLQPSHYGILFYTKEAKDSKIYEIRHPHKRDRKQGYLWKDYGGKKDLLHPFGPLVSDVWTDIHRIRHNLRRDEHPCQLPPHLLERIVLMTTDEGDIVLDPFSGTGTTAIAAKSLGRNYIGFEIDPEYVIISQKKLSKTHLYPRIGKAWVSWYLDNIVTIREIDWEEIEKYFIIPRDIKLVDKEKIILKREMPLLQNVM